MNIWGQSKGFWGQYTYLADILPRSSARAHLKGEDDKLVRVKPMLDRIDKWNAYLADANKRNDEDLIKRHTRTGRPLGCADFIRKLEGITGRELAPRRPDRKPAIRK